MKKTNVLIILIVFLSSCTSKKVIENKKDTYLFSNLPNDFFFWKTFYFLRETNLSVLEDNSFLESNSNSTLNYLSHDELAFQKNIQSKDIYKKAVVYVKTKDLNDVTKKIFSTIDFENRVNWKQDIKLSIITREMFFSPFYRHPIINVEVAPKYFQFIEMVFNDIKIATKDKNNEFYKIIKNSKIKIEYSNVPLKLWVDRENQIIHITPALIRAVLLNTGYDELDFELSDFSSERSKIMLRSLIYIRTFHLLSFLITHELAHIYLNNKIKNHYEDQCDCIASLLSNNLETQRYLGVNWGTNSNSSSNSLSITLSNTIDIRKQSLWGLKKDFSINERERYLKEINDEKRGLNFCMQRLYYSKAKN